MTIKEIKKLAEQSFINSKLDTKIIKKIIARLKKKELKVYIKFLKKLENERLVRVFLPVDKIEDKIIREIRNMFPGKKIEYVTDSNLIAGLRVIDNDMVYEFNLKDSLKRIIKYLRQSYD